MSKYISVGKLIKKFEKMINNIPASVDSGAGYVINEVYKIIDSFQQEQSDKYETALEKAREWMPNVNQGGHAILIDIFPELEEGLDNRYGDRKQKQPNKSFCEENCKGYRDTGGKCFFDFNCSIKKAQKQPETNLEQKFIEDVAKEVIKDKESAIKFLKSAGIMDENGNLAELYRSEEDEKMLTEVTSYLAVMKLYEQVPEEDRKEICKLIDWLVLRFKNISFQSNLEWNEEDDKMIQFYDDDYNNRLGDKSMSYIIEMRLKFRDWIINRFKFLCIRPKREWSEKDEDCYSEICRIINNFADSPEENRELTDWLIKTVYKQ